MCQAYKDKLEDTYGTFPTPKDRRIFIEEQFTVLASNTNYFKRTNLEGLAITLHSPTLNNQSDFHKSFSII